MSSNINPNIPPPGGEILSSELRLQFQAAKTEIEALQVIAADPNTALAVKLARPTGEIITTLLMGWAIALAQTTQLLKRAP
jgi:ABC-type antimicrobial peptide transport system ATPase subunit